MEKVASAATAQSLEALNSLLKNSQQQEIEFARKVVKTIAQSTVGAEIGKGASLDTSA